MAHPLIRYLHGNQFIAGIVFLGLCLLLLEIKSILIAVFIAYIIMAALSPVVEYLTQKRVPKIIAVAITYLVTLSLVVLLIIPLVPFFVAQIQSLFTSFPRYLEGATRLLGITINPSEINNLVASEAKNIGGNAIVLTQRVFGGLFSVLTVLVVSFYLLADHKRMRQSIAGFFPHTSKTKAHDTLEQIEEKLGAWMRGQITLSLFIGFITWITLTVLGVQFALPLALLAGMLEIVPTIGPIVSAIPAIIVALNVSPTLALIVTIAYIIIQLLENNVLVPKIMEKAVGLHPIVVILAVMTGAKLMGVLGALLSIPFLSILIIIYKSLQEDE